MIRTTLQSRWFLWACLGLGVVLRLAWILAFRGIQQASDFGWYLARALSLADGHGYSISGTPTAFWPIGYPLFLSLMFRAFGHHVLVGQIANVALYAGIIFVAYLLSLDIFSSPAAAGLTAFLLALYPNHIAYSAILLSETLFTFLMLLGAWLTLRSPRHSFLPLIAGVVWGLAILTKPQGLVVAAVVLFCLLPQAKTTRKPAGWFKNVAVVVVGALLVLVPYSVRNYRAFHRVVFVSTNGGVNLLIGNNPFADGKYLEDPRLSDLTGAQGNEAERDAAAGRWAIGYIASHPLRFLALTPRKLFYLYAWDFDGVRWTEKGMSSSRMLLPMRILAQVMYMAVGTAFLLATVRWLRKKRRAAGTWWSQLAIGLWIVLAWTLVHLVLFGYARFHYPMIPWLVLSGATLVDWDPRSLTSGPAQRSASRIRSGGVG